jgi:hypothetical protein
MREAPGLPQSEIAGNKEHYHHNTNNVENIVHVSSSFLSRDRIAVEPDAHNIIQRKGKREALSCCLTVRCGSLKSQIQ